MANERKGFVRFLTNKAAPIGPDQIQQLSKSYVIDDRVDAIFVVKDPMSDRLHGLTKRLLDKEFSLRYPDVGALSLRLKYLHEVDLRAGYLDPVAHLPAQDVPTYSVATFLVARSGLTQHELVAARELVSPLNQFPSEDLLDLSHANEVAQGVEALLGICVYIGLAFLALLGLDVVAYRRRFNELNTLVSLISMHQSSKDVNHPDPEERARHIVYLRYCSDLLGLIAVITGYYAQENTSLLYNRMLEIINDRCDGMKLNVQLKILHSTIPLVDESYVEQPNE